MIILQAILLGIIEGLTEFLPISSTGHLIVAEHAMGYHDAAELFTVVIQIGSISAVAWVYRKDFIQRITGFFKRDSSALKFWKNLAIAGIPVIIIGVIANKYMDTYAVPIVVALALIIGGVLLWLVEEFHVAPRSKNDAKIDDITPRQALGVGLCQVVSLIPGVSRSGSTIVGGMLCGLDRVTATAFSFFLGVPILFMATGYKLAKDHGQIAHLPGGVPALVAGIIAAFVSGLIVVRWLLRYVSGHDFKLFAYYRVAFGGLILILIATGLLAAR